MAWDNEGNREFQQAPVGNHAAICTTIIELGTQDGEWQGQPTKRQQVHFTWELPNETMEDGRPFTISKFYTRSLHEKAGLTKDLTSWLGKTPELPFDPATLLGKACQVNVIENADTGKRKVTSVSSLAKGMQIPKNPTNETYFFDLDNFSDEIYEKIPNGLKKIIEKSPEYAKIMSGGEEFTQTKGQEDIPF